MPSTSNIRVSVHFNQSTVYAGEDVECVITFKNVARHHHHCHNDPPPRRSIPPSTKPQIRPLPSAIATRSGRSSSVTSPTTPAHEAPRTLNGSVHPSKSHNKSLSIVSLASDTPPNTRANDAVGAIPIRKTSQGHSRSASLQPLPRRDASSAANQNPGLSRSWSKPAPPAIKLHDAPLAVRPGRSNSLRSNSSLVPGKRSPSTLQQEYKFPPAKADESDVSMDPSEEGDSISPKDPQSPGKRTPRDPDTISALNPITRVISGTSVNGTPRSSIDLYSMSNHSDETLASEYPTQPLVRPSVRGTSFRRSSKLSDVEEHAGPETLMMGHAQIMGSFSLDGSLVNQAPFEGVKRKGVVGGQGGGGVVGLETRKRDSGLFGSLAWSNIGESLGDLLGGSEMSSIKEMRTKANSKAIPLISTPQSILFVDLQLNPGESRRYSYTFTLPRGLPPSHKGRAMKIAYHIAIGVQRPGYSIEQRVRTVEVPFRVFGTVNARGDILSHDLLAPHIYLQDLAKTASLGTEKGPTNTPESNLTSFLSYVDALMGQQTINSGLLSPTTPLTPHMRRHSSIAEPTTSREAIDLAVMRSNQSRASKLSTRFTIARSGRPVATIMLPRAAYRLGETIHLIIDFSPPDPADQNSHEAAPSNTVTPGQIPVHAILVTLESAERIDQAIAMRSPQSIYRYTRKVHAHAAETALFARRLSFALAIPPGATPEFGTTGIGLEWRIKVEFVTPRLRPGPVTKLKKPVSETKDDQEVEESESSDELDEWVDKEWPDLLEQVHSDDRGEVLQGAEMCHVETFEVSVPLRVYGSAVDNKSEVDAIDLAV